MELLNEVKRVTGWNTLIEHELFPLLLAASASTTILWLYPGTDRLLAAYFPNRIQTAAVHMAVPAPQPAPALTGTLPL
jgi:hypothetical protein